ncbi:MAG: hypothetical protein ACREPF_07600 [Rhodanobacteraceae bacterium]
MKIDTNQVRICTPSPLLSLGTRGVQNLPPGSNTIDSISSSIASHLPKNGRHSGAARAACGQKPESSSWRQSTKRWIPGSIADEAGDGPGMTMFFLTYEVEME